MTSPASPTSPCSRFSTAARSRPASPPPPRDGNIMAHSRPGAGLSGLRREHAALAGRRHGDRPRALLHHRLLGVGERPADRPRRSPHAGARPQRQPDQRRRAARRAARPRRPFRSTSDSEIIAALLATHPAERIEDAVADVLPRLSGRLLDRGHDRGRRRRLPRPPRPAAPGHRADRPTPGSDEAPAWCVASESCALDLIGATLIREVLPGEVGHPQRLRAARAPGGAAASAAPSASSSTSTSPAPTRAWAGTVLQVARARMGENLWREAPVDADVVIPVPDSGNAAARGLARASGLPTRTTASSRTATSRGRSSSRARRCAARACG